MAKFIGTPIRGTDFASVSDEAISAKVSSDTHARIRIDAGGRLTWGSGSSSGDINLYRDSASVLATDDIFKATGGLVTVTANGAPNYNSPDGAIAVDIANNEFYFRSNGTWNQVIGGGGNASLTISDTPPTEELVAGDLWYESDSGKTFVYYDSFWVEIGNSGSAVVAENIAGNATTASQLETARIISLTNDLSGSVSFNGSQNVSISASVDYSAINTNIIPALNNTYTLGTPTMRWQEVYVGPGSLYIEDAATNQNVEITVQNGLIKLDGQPLSASIAGNSVALGTHTTGSYVQSLVAGTGVTLTNNSGESATPTIAIGQAVETTSNVTFNDLTVSGNLTVSGTTTTVNTSTLSVADNVVTLNSDVTTGSPTENAGIEVLRGFSPTVSMRWNETSDKWEFTTDGSAYSTVAGLGSIALGTDTSGSYVQSLVAGTGVTITNNSGESATPTIAIGQSVATSATPTFSSITATATPGLTLSHSSGDEGGEMLLAKPATNSTIAGTGVTIDVYQNKLRFFEQGGSARGAFIDITTAGAGASTDIVNKNLDNLTDVTITGTPSDKQLLVYDSATSQWKNADAIVSSGIAYKAGFPASKTSTGILGQICIDGANGIMYVCTGTNTWQKVSMNAANFTNAGGFA